MDHTMMNVLGILVLLVFLAGCQGTDGTMEGSPGTEATDMMDTDEPMATVQGEGAETSAEEPVQAEATMAPMEDPDRDHMGCQEGEILEDGTCVPADSGANNAGLFDQDLEPLVVTEEVTEGALGYLAKPREPGTYPGVVMIHEWWGLNDNIRYMARRLAAEGYVVLAVDLYGGQVAADSDGARELATSVRTNPEKAIADLKAAAAYLREVEGVSKVASLGWCFGGQQSLQLALNEGLDATVIYYGQLVTDTEQLSVISWPVLGIFGAEDGGIPVDSVRAFEAALNELGVRNEIVVYPGVGHAFANPSGSRYAAEETLDAWARTTSFLATTLKTEP